ncbi:hypothetical protein L0F63_006312, partial [Massospora cicadina]
FDYQKLLSDVANGTCPYTKKNFTQGFCVDIKAGKVCNQPEGMMFWDDFHPTSEVHEIMAKAADDLINLRSNQYGYAYTYSLGKVGLV